jgi:hypothetical protein
LKLRIQSEVSRVWENDYGYSESLIDTVKGYSGTVPSYGMVVTTVSSVQ